MNINEIFENLKNDFINYIPNLAIAIFIIIIFYIIANYYKNNVFNNNIKSESSKDLIYYELSYIIYYLILIFGFLFALIYLGFNTATIIAVLSICGLAIGFAFQSSLSNIISGIIIILLNLYEIGDVIKLNQLSYSTYTLGKVIDFNLYSTTLLDPITNSIITLPNSIIQSNVLTNTTKSQYLYG